MVGTVVGTVVVVVAGTVVVVAVVVVVVVAAVVAVVVGTVVVVAAVVAVVAADGSLGTAGAAHAVRHRQSTAKRHIFFTETHPFTIVVYHKSTVL